MYLFSYDTQKVTICKSTNFSGQLIFKQLLSFIDKLEINKITKLNQAERYVKKFSTYNHLVVMLFATFENYYSIGEVVVGLLSNAQKIFDVALLKANCILASFAVHPYICG